MYEYAARVVSVYDGDTCKLTIDLGFRVYLVETIRLEGVNTPELKQKGGSAARTRFDELLREGDGTLLIRTTRDRREKYGRMLAFITNSNGINVGQALVDEGHAKPYSGGRR